MLITLGEWGAGGFTRQDDDRGRGSADASEHAHTTVTFAVHAGTGGIMIGDKLIPAFVSPKRQLNHAIPAALVLALAIAPAAARATPGDLDPSFGTGGQMRLPAFAAGSDDSAAGMVLAPDGSIVLAGTTGASTGSHVAVARLLPSGKLDPSWNGTGEAVGPSTFRVVGAVRQPSDGKIVLAFSTNSPGVINQFALARFTLAGQLDPTFNPTGPTPGEVVLPSFFPADGTHLPFSIPSGVGIEPDGSIVEAGWVNPGNEVGGQAETRIGVAKVDAAGHPVTAFTSAGRPAGERIVPALDPNTQEFARAVGIDPTSGAIVIAADPSLVDRLDSSGNLDPTFNGTGQLRLPRFTVAGDDTARALAVAPGGSIVVGFTTDLQPSTPGAGALFSVARVTPAGHLDSGFHGTGELVLPQFPGSSNDTTGAVAIGTDGKIVEAGSSSVSGASRGSVARITPSGGLDPAFGSAGQRVLPPLTSGSAESLATAAIEPDGRVLVAGTSTTAGSGLFAIERLLGANPVIPPGKPVLGRLSLGSKTFRAAKSGGSVAAKQTTGTNISYTDSVAASTTFRVLRSTPGAQRGHRCVKATKRRGRAKRCTRYLLQGSFTHADAAGTNKVHFTGRVRGRTLRPGSYRLSASARLGGRSSHPRVANFRVIR